ncbi:GMC oxidoreductase [Methylomonas sp. EFPC3]|uniref:GMC family oxidoreductase N-terminal domain-containing protein n=1 Tax=Methylomonas sp. EFPC3 TaxID=3021710 RepID=UPI002415C39E|nr:GMC oxidoreductase [Methylomonas sp. EFPC3]WFP49081.1 GMC oxidoreductase [Methylomonas sp. EFPC3]
MAGPDLDYEAIIIGSGFGGSISFCRLAQKWGSKVLLLERGRRYPMASFARSPKQIADSFWSIDGNAVKRPKHIQDKKLRGLFDIRNYKKMDAVISAGLGGGSLIYANVFLEPPAQVFEQGWPAAINQDTLKPYYQVAKQVLGARPVPSWQSDPRRQIVRTELFQEFAAHDNRTSKLADICVFFGNDYSYNGREQPLAIGLQEKNRYGATQTSCTYCGECDIGCNTHSKNTLDLNYLYAGEHHHGGQIQTDRQAEKIVPLGADGRDDPQAGGEHGYRVEFRDLEADTLQSVTARRVVVSAGTFGTNELLLRCRDVFGTLPKLSAQLGRWFSGNGDFLSFAIEGKKDADPNYGPVITQYTDYHLFDRFQRNRAFIMEDASYPATLAWYIEGAFPTSLLRKLVRAAKAFIAWLKKYLVNGIWNGSLGFSLHEILKDDLSSKSGVLLCMGLDNGDGTLTLNQEGRIDLDWPQDTSMGLYQAILDTGKRFNAFIKGKLFLPLPTWELPVKHNVTVHPLGGCILADSAEKGVVSAAPLSRGQAFGYQGLYVADGSILPSAVGANPIATISATAEWIAEGITGISPDASLGV